ncbi:MAG: DUF5682 family protein [Bacteroidota bacterium]
MSVHVFGIRHHGPGSARSMLQGLRALAPDIVLIEGPPDGDALIPFVANEGLKPPVALLVYNPKDLQEAAYYPFASFSPEWQAMAFALQKNLPVRFMDLPRRLAFTLNRLEKDNPQLRILPPTPEQDESELPAEVKARVSRDPFGYLAQLAGYADSERWWEVMFEAQQNPEAIFPTIVEMIDALRQSKGSEDEAREQQREAHMRQVIRQAQKEGFEKIAVVCGAWHSPALQYLDRYKASHDKAILRGIKKTSTKATWVPWTYQQLSTQSGYAAGVLSPAWYQLLFHRPKDVLIRWMTKVARLFRKEDLDSSSAHVIEAVRLAETLASLRGLRVAGIEEMNEAAMTIFCQGYQEQLQIIEQKLVVGDVMGKVPPEVPVIPLQQDLDRQIKSARLTKYRKTSESLWLKANASNPRGGIDLREEADRIKSHLLHRLNILRITWGKVKKGSKRDLGGFKEYWKLQWKPGFAISIIEAGRWGNTVEKAASAYLLDDLQQYSDLPQLTQRIEAALNANLSATIGPLIRRIEDVSALTKDVYHLMDALPPLINALRYGSSRRVELSALQKVVDLMVPRICVALPNASLSLDEAASRELFDKILQTNHSISLLEQPKHQSQWHQLLHRLSEMYQVHSLLTGASTRILFDKALIDTGTAAQRMNFALSRGNDSDRAAHWVEGFLHGSGLLLIHHPGLWQILDEWIADLTAEVFQDILPLLRRTFAEFSGPERAKMLALARRESGVSETPDAERSFDAERGEGVIPVVQLLLGHSSSAVPRGEGIRSSSSPSPG